MNSSRALLTGISGFVGNYLTRELMARGWQVAGLVPPFEKIDSSQEPYSRVELFSGDLLNPGQIRQCLESYKPDIILHLAAESAPSKSFNVPEQFFNVNVTGTQNLFEAIRKTTPESRCAIFTSSDMYGYISPDQIPVTEETPLKPANPYAASKVACHLILQQYTLNFGLTALEIRPFNMIGPGQRPGFVLPDWCQQVAKINKGMMGAEMKVGRLTDQRDFVDVRDAARAMADIAEKGESGGVYQICSGRGIVVEDILKTLLELSPKEIKVSQNPQLLRPTKMPVLVGSYIRVNQLCGWKPEISLEQTIIDTLEYWSGVI